MTIIKKLPLTVAMVLFLILILGGCDGGNTSLNRQRQLANASTVTIAAVWPWSIELRQFEQGMDLAVSEINNDGGILGKKLTLLKRDDQSSLDKGLLIANELKNNLNISAVIGHIDSYISIPASSIYHLSGLLMLTPGTTATQLTTQGFPSLFRIIPNNKQLANNMTNYLQENSYQKIVILYPRTAYGLDLANQVEQEAKRKGISVEDRYSYLDTEKHQTEVLLKWKEFYQFDAVVFIGILPQAISIIQNVRHYGIEEPIIAGDGLDDPLLFETAVKEAEGMVVLSFYNEEQTTNKNKQFIQLFEKTYGETPDASAALGYDAIHLLADAMRESKSILPDVVSNYLHSMPPWKGVTGLIYFDQNGDLVREDTVTRKKFVNGKLQVLK